MTEADRIRATQHDLAVDLRTLTHCWNQATLKAALAGVVVRATLEEGGSGLDAPALRVDLYTELG